MTEPPGQVLFNSNVNNTGILLCYKTAKKKTLKVLKSPGTLEVSVFIQARQELSGEFLPQQIEGVSRPSLSFGVCLKTF